MTSTAGRDRKIADALSKLVEESCLGQEEDQDQEEGQDEDTDGHDDPEGHAGGTVEG